MNIDLSVLAQWAGSIVSLWALVNLVVTPFQSAIRKNDETMKKHMDSIVKLNHTLDLINRDIDDSKTDRLNIHRRLDSHDERLDKHNERIIEHKERIDALFKRGGG